MRKFIYSPVYPISTRLETSHRAGWAMYWAQEIGAQILTSKDDKSLYDVSPNDEVYLYHGMEFNTNLNLQSGIGEAVWRRLKIFEHVAKSKARVVSLDGPNPAYFYLVRRRAEKEDPPANIEYILDWKFCEIWERSKVKPLLYPTSEKTTRIILGDSHALSQYTPGSTILRHDGLTLHGALKQGIKNLLGDHIANPNISTVVVYFGNIDIRHHLMRHGNPRESVKTLMVEFYQQLSDLPKKLKIQIVSPLPIENESRILPKSGYFMGTPFYGSWKERTEIRQEFVDHLISLSMRLGRATIVHHPDYFSNEVGELDFGVMELPRSVHIRPSLYRLCTNGKGWTCI